MAGADAGQIGINDDGSDFNMHYFQMRQVLGRISTTKIAKVVKVTPGQNGQAGTVDVQLLTNQMDGEGKSTPHGTVYGIPYVRAQNGQHALIMEPAVGDIGPIHVFDRDVSSNIAKRDVANPGSNRRFSPSDSIFMGGILNAKATTTREMSGGNITDTAGGGNITHAATKKDNQGGAISHSSDADMTHTSGGTISQISDVANSITTKTSTVTASTSHTVTAPEIKHNGHTDIIGGLTVDGVAVPGSGGGGGGGGGGGVNAQTFGAVPDAVMTVNVGGGTQSVTGTDSTSSIQTAIDFALQNNVHTVFLPDGNYKVTDTLQLGWGNSFYSIALVALSETRAGYKGLTGVNIFSTKTDRPVINIQGGRRILIKGITLWGLNYVWIVNNREATYSFSAIPGDWLDPVIAPAGTSPGGIQRHSPYAAITIDAYKSTQPTDHYPTVTYPSWTGIGVTQYGKLETSDVLIEDVNILGFGAGIVGSPNGTNQGDFIKIRDCNITECVYGIAIGNGESRNVEVRNVTYASLHTFISSTTFGDQDGVLNGPIDNVSGGVGYQLFSLESGTSLPLTFKNCYFEAQVRIGEIIGNESLSGPLMFEGCVFNFNEQDTHHIIPPGLINNSGNISIIFKGTKFAGCSRIPNLVYGTGTSDITLDAGVIQTGSFITGAGGSLGYARALNYTAGMLIGAGTPAPQFPFDTPTIHATSSSIRGRYVNTSTFSIADWPIASDLRFIYGFVRAPLNQFVQSYTDANGVTWRFGAQPQRVLNLAGGDAQVHPAFAADILTFEYTASSNNAWPAHVGDIWYHENTGTLFVTTALGAPDGAHANAIPITAKQMNNMIVDGTGAFASQTCSDLTLAGNTFLINCSIDLPQKIEFGTFTAGSTSVTSVSAGDGDGSDITTYYAVNDGFYAYDKNDTYFSWPTKVGNKIATITNGSPGSMTLSANALATGRFPIFPIPIR